MKQCLLLSLVLLCSVAGAAPEVTVGQVWPVAPKGDIRVLVKEAMTLAREKGELNHAKELAERSDEALPFLEAYSKEENANVRWVVMTIARRSHSPRALRLLSNVLVRPSEGTDVTKYALESITRGYNRKELRAWGGPLLAQSMRRFAGRDSNWAEAILILPAFSGETTRSFLRRLRATPSSESYTLDEFSPEMKRPFVIDIALAELGDKTAVKRLKRVFRRRGVGERMWLCHALPFIHNPSLLRLVPPMLRDERIAKERIMYATGPVECVRTELPPIRVCDVAALALSFRKDGNTRGNLYGSEPLTAKELAKARKQHLGGNDARRRG